MWTTEEMGIITCHCGLCKIILNDPTPKCSLLCACEDCRQALLWCATNGGKKPTEILNAIYVRSDISAIEGMSEMGVFQLRNEARSTRVYCKSCFSIIGIDHGFYADNVFMFLLNYCKIDFTISVDQCALIHFKDYKSKKLPKILPEIPIFYSFEFDQERQRFHQIPTVNNTFKSNYERQKGISFSEVIKKIGPIRVLDLEPGLDPK